MTYTCILCLSWMAACLRAPWLTPLLGMAAFQAISELSSSDPDWLLNQWLPGEIFATIGVALSVFCCILQETQYLKNWLRMSLRIGVISTGASLAGLVWITARYETFYWRFCVFRNELWLASAIALISTIFFISLWDSLPKRLDIWLLAIIASAHTALALVTGSQPYFRLAVGLACVLWLLGPLFGRVSRSLSWPYRLREPSHPLRRA